MNLKYSVIIPARNREAVIGRAIESALNQQAQPFDIIVVDDCSEDNTAKVAEGYSTTEIPVRVVRLAERKGAPNARNVGVAKSGQPLQAFLDSDDAWRPEKLRLQIDVFQSNPNCPAVFTNIVQHHSDGPTFLSCQPIVQLEDLFERNIIGSCSTAVVRKDAFLNAGGFDVSYPSCQDWELWLKLAKTAPLHVVQKHLTDYYFDGSERISKNPSRVTEGHLAIFDAIYKLVPDEARRDMIRREHRLTLSEAYLYTLDDPKRCLYFVLPAIFSIPVDRKNVHAARLARRSIRKLFTRSN